MAGKLSFFWFFLLSFSFTDTSANGASPTCLRPSGLMPRLVGALVGVGSGKREQQTSIAI